MLYTKGKFMNEIKEISEMEITTLENNLNKTDYEKKSYTLSENGKNIFDPLTTHIIENQTKYDLHNYFNKIIVNDIGVNIVLEISNNDAVWRKELDIVETKNQKINKMTINLNELVSYKIFSRKFMYLNQFDVRKNIHKSVETNFNNKLNEGILFGDGVNEPKGILVYETSENLENNKLLKVKVNPKTILVGLLNMESILISNNINNRECLWIISRKLYMLLQQSIFALNNNPLVNNGAFALSREGNVTYLFNIPMVIINDFGEKEVDIILIHKDAYTILENPQIDYVENSQDIDIKLYFIKYFGGAITNFKGIVLGYLKEN